MTLNLAALIVLRRPVTSFGKSSPEPAAPLPLAVGFAVVPGAFSPPLTTSLGGSGM